eukprot:9534027-Ditylum_brightwellii.AAC.1
MHHVTETLNKHKNNFPDNNKDRYQAFCSPQVLNTYAVPALYAKTLVSDIKLDKTNSYDRPPNAWARGPPKNTNANNAKQNKATNNNNQQNPSDKNTTTSKENGEIQWLRTELQEIKT